MASKCIIISARYSVPIGRRRRSPFSPKQKFMGANRVSQAVAREKSHYGRQPLGMDKYISFVYGG